MERAIETLIKNFHQYSVEGGKETLTPAELQDLVTQQLPHLMPVLSGPRPRQHPDFPGKASETPPTLPRLQALASPSPSPCQCQVGPGPASCPWAGWGRTIGGSAMLSCGISPPSEQLWAGRENRQLGQL